MTEQNPYTPNEEPLMLPEVVPGSQLVPPDSNATPIVDGGSDYFTKRHLHELEQHGRDVRLARKIFALAEEPEEQRVEIVPTSEATPRYKKAVRELSQGVLNERKLFIEAMTNPVTGLPNRRAYELALKERISNPVEQDVAVAFLDLNGFKQINDTYGHETGDELMRNFGEELVARVRESDIVMHFGGDEFAVIMSNYRRSEMSDSERDAKAKQRFYNAVESVKQKLNISFGTSIGIARYEPGDTVQSLTARADEAMYEDKRNPKRP